MDSLRQQAFVFIVLAGCGHSIITTGGSASTASGGSGATNGSTIAVTGSVGPTSNDATVSTGTGPNPGDPQFCDKFCAAVGNCFGDCHAVCQSYLLPPCDKEGGQLASCLAGNWDATTCGSTNNICQPLADALSTCRAKTPQNCTGNGGNTGSDYCTLTATCPGGEERAICNYQGDAAACECYLNTQLLGGCGGKIPTSGVTTPCDLKMGCCQKYFGS